MNPNHVNAVEKHLSWLKFSESQADNEWTSKGNHEMITALPIYRSVLRHAVTFYMDEKFAQLVDGARRSVPDELAWDSTWLLAPRGFIWIEKPFNTPDLNSARRMFASDPSAFANFIKQLPHEQQKGLRVTESTDSDFEPTDEARMRMSIEGLIKVAAVGWDSLPAGTITRSASGQTQTLDKPAIQFACFLELGKGFLPWSYFIIQEGQHLIDRIRQYEGSIIDGATYDTATCDSLHEVRWVYTALYMMAQKIAITVTEKTDRGVRRRAEREGTQAPEIIKVVKLRRYEEARTRAIAAGANPVDWQWQWEVTGHWRSQFYPSENAHRQIFIDSYIKGPEDKPFRNPGARLFVATR